MNNLMAGFARVNATPPLGIGIAGYFQERLAEGVLDELEVNALALSNGDVKVVLLSFDICYIKNDILAAYKEHISKVTGLPFEAIYIHATHTHTAPLLKRTPDSPYNYLNPGEEVCLEDEYAKMVCLKMADAAKMALDDLKPAKMGWGVGQAPGVAFIRRYRMKDGSVRTNPGVNNPEVLEPIGKTDERVHVLRFDREGADTICCVNFGNHPDCVGGNLISGDWPNFVRSTVEKTLDNTKCIFFNGAQGDINHVKVFAEAGDMNGMFIDFDDVSRGYSHAQYIGRVVTGGVLQAFDKVKYVEVDDIKCAMKMIRVPSNMPKPEEMEEARYINEMHVSGRDAELPYQGMMLTTMVADAARKIRLEHGPEFFEMELIAIKVGDIAFVGIPGEPFGAIGMALKETEGFEQVIPTCLTNGSNGYFPSADAYEQGGYESRSSNFGPLVAETIVTEARQMLAELKK